ncbi:NAD(P)H-dependent oxidoreductase [Microbispora bryophytorum]|uniref:Uncharacterized protein n=1 Tax=Microbispora bryophytorum TaxID=1460882 RepID=A0A8H9GU04_9ACTN|nr:NAD(P)H-dependent oxidoreductase [Microbispora bryophytorum]MBD3135544.1 hypothetical protein [Microbispora bryophytorum]TQS09729.1 NAD(P)H-dependent oxidoreductase [Microbispora bryophytorum]GGN98219.1 hypothetical protein GCM10011574_02560 [Microbispora bryophytorum]
MGRHFDHAKFVVGVSCGDGGPECGVQVDLDTGSSRLRDTAVTVVTARGGAYGPGTPREGFEFQTPYLRT